MKFSKLTEKCLPVIPEHCLDMKRKWAHMKVGAQK